MKKLRATFPLLLSFGLILGISIACFWFGNIS